MDETLGEEHAGVIGECGFDLRIRTDDGGSAADDVAEARVVFEEDGAE